MSKLMCLSCTQGVSYPDSRHIAFILFSKRCVCSGKLCSRNVSFHAAKLGLRLFTSESWLFYSSVESISAFYHNLYLTIPWRSVSNTTDAASWKPSMTFFFSIYVQKKRHKFKAGNIKKYVCFANLFLYSSITSTSLYLSTCLSVHTHTHTLTHTNTQTIRTQTHTRASTHVDKCIHGVTSIPRNIFMQSQLSRLHFILCVLYV